MNFIDRRIRPFNRYLSAGRERGLYCFMRGFDSAAGPRVSMDGRELVMLASNNYLGLTTHPAVVEAAAAALRKYGTGAGSVRMIGGTMDLHLRLEERIAALKGSESAMTFTSGYAANVSAISALLLKARDLVIMDERAHARLQDACRLSGLKPVFFAHNDVEDLRRVLSTLSPETGKLVVVDGVYSVDGDIAPLDSIREVCDSHGAALLVDEAHSTGVLGDRGRGTPSHFGLEGKVDLVMGTLSKALASSGGFAAGSRELIEYLRHHSRAFLFSTAMTPPDCAAALAAIDVMLSEPGLTERLARNARRLRDGLSSLGCCVADVPTPIVPLTIGSDFDSYRVALRLQELGVYATPFIFPAVPKGRAALRLTAIAPHSESDIDRALEALASVMPMVREARERAGMTA